MKRYNIPAIRSIFGAPPPDTAALVELKRWRQRADELIRENQVGVGVDLIATSSELTREYRQTRKSLLAPSDRLKLIMIVTPPLPRLLPAGDEAVQK